MHPVLVVTVAVLAFLAASSPAVAARIVVSPRSGVLEHGDARLRLWAYGALSSGGPGGQEVRTTADKVGAAFVTQATAAQAYTKLLPLGYEVWFLAPSYQSGGTAVAPPPDVLNRMFGPVSPSGDPRTGGVGMTLDRLVRSTTPKNWSSTACVWDG